MGSNIEIWGTCNGKRYFYKDDKSIKSILTNKDSDLRVSNSEPLGNTCYSIGLDFNLVTFTKYIVIIDVLRESTIGYIGFTLFHKNSEKSFLTPSDIIKALDELCEEFTNRYLEDYKLYSLPSDWSFIDKILSKYETVNTNALIFPSASTETKKDGAIIYYETEEELLKYVENPNQKLYRDYVQVYLVDKNFKSQEDNPLNSLKNSGEEITHLIDLDNKTYILPSFRNADGIKVEVWANGEKKLEREEIYSKDSLKITFSKDHHDSFPKDGKLTELSGILKISPTNELEFIYPSLSQKKNRIRIEVFLNNERVGNSSFDIAFLGEQPKNNHPKKGELIFEGEEIGKNWSIEVSLKGKNISPKKETILASGSGTIEVSFKEKKVGFFSKILKDTRFLAFAFILIGGGLLAGGYFMFFKEGNTKEGNTKEDNTEKQSPNEDIETAESDTLEEAQVIDSFRVESDQQNQNDSITDIGTQEVASPLQDTTSQTNTKTQEQTQNTTNTKTEFLKLLGEFDKMDETERRDKLIEFLDKSTEKSSTERKFIYDNIDLIIDLKGKRLSDSKSSWEKFKEKIEH